MSKIGLKRGRLVLPFQDYKNLCLDVYHRDHWKCRCCKVRGGLTAHHIVYRSDGGDDAMWNLISLCAKCHDLIHKPSPSGPRLAILPNQEGEIIDADGPVRFILVKQGTGELKVA